MKRLMIIGAGRTGRGFLGRLAAEEKIPLIFVDKDRKTVENLEKARQDGGFWVRFYGNEKEPVRVSDYQVCTPDQADFSCVDLILVSVGSSNLCEVGTWLKENLPDNRPVYIITCENASGPADQLQKAIGLPDVHVSEAAVFCTTDFCGDMDIVSEAYPYLPYDGERLAGFDPGIAAFRAEKNFGNFLRRKIYTYNSASGIIAYIGWLYGYQDYAEAANDPRILELLDRNYAAINRAICKEFGYDESDQEEFARLSKKKFTNRAITDSISRNARDPLRKLGPEERIVGPLTLLKKHGEDTSVLAKTAAAALLYEDENDAEWTKIKKEMTPEQILRKYGKLEDEELLEEIGTGGRFRLTQMGQGDVSD